MSLHVRYLKEYLIIADNYHLIPLGRYWSVGFVCFWFWIKPAWQHLSTCWQWVAYIKTRGIEQIFGNTIFVVTELSFWFRILLVFLTFKTLNHLEAKTIMCLVFGILLVEENSRVNFFLFFLTPAANKFQMFSKKQAFWSWSGIFCAGLQITVNICVSHKRGRTQEMPSKEVKEAKS